MDLGGRQIATKPVDWSRIRALASDYDGTLAHEGQIAEATTAALGRFKASGRHLILVTGRELPPLVELYRYLGFFDAVVCENGGLLFLPQTEEETPLAPGPTDEFIAALRARGVEPLNVGRVIVATTIENEEGLADVVAKFGHHWRLIRNKDSVMALPKGVDKASGLKVAMEALSLNHHHVLGVGDAENDESFLAECGVSAAVANALPGLKAKVNVVTRGADGAGVVELIDKVLAGQAVA